MENAREYLEQARFLDMRINAKLAQLDSLNNLLLKAGDAAPDKILSLQSDINRDIDELVDLKAEITRRIRQLSKPEYQTVLELRYLCFMTWEEIGGRMRYSMPYLFKLHTRALKELGKDLEEAG